MSGSIPLPSTGSMGVLVVEEDDGVRTLLDLWVRQLGYPVWTAPGGRQALELLRVHQAAIQVVLLDVGMAGWDGPATLKALRTISPSLRCCFLTGNGGILTEEDLLPLGVDRVIQKPFVLEEITQAVRAAGVRPERRATQRASAAPAKVVVRPAEKGEEWDSWILDRSASGLGLMLPRPVVCGAVLSVTDTEGQQDSETRLEVRHCRPVKDGWFVGGRLLTQSI